MKFMVLDIAFEAEVISEVVFSSPDSTRFSTGIYIGTNLQWKKNY